ncbi:MAG: leucine-rich repeat protein, partial [Clostridiales bacterium]|nr:leucine-rich repeat protein [Clostridiales bacterium]
MKKRSLNKIKQMVSIGMSCIMAGSTCNLPMMLHAEEVQTESMKPTYMVTSFDELNEEIAYQALSIGAEESEINFPDTLKVKVIRQVEGEPSTEADEEESSTEAVEEEASTEAEEETTSKVLESQTEAESQTEEESEVESGTETEVESQTEIESELQTEVENETLESESETEVPMTETEVPETTAALEPQTQVPETTVSESETESTEQLESDTTEEESSIVASLIDSIKGLFTPVEVYAAEEYIAYSAGEGNGAEDSQEGEEWTIEHITWKLDAEKSSLPEFDSSEESAGAVYIYTPTIPETDENGNHYILSEEATLPEIYVMVDCVDNGIVLYSSNILASGTCGAELTWILDDEGVLTISGTGGMANWKRKGSPWYANEDKIESVVIEDGVTSIGKYAFGYCSSLASIKLPNSISSIGDTAFSNCSSLASITLPNSISSIGELAFYYCSSLTSITIPNSVTNIEKLAFGGCSKLASITISNSVTGIAESAFESCWSLKSITIPNNVISIGKNAFYNCSRLTSVIYLGTAEQWNAIKKGEYALSSAQLKNVKCHEHLPETAWSNNDTCHWHQCTDGACPVKDEPQAQDSYALHDWENGICSECGYICKHTGGTATCTKKAVCTECGIEYGEKDSNKHENLYHAAQAPTCTKNGYEAYWRCKNCAKLFSDEAGTHEIINPLKINANGHALEKVEKKEAGCTETGHEAYWRCKNCAKLFSDEAG